MTFKPDELRDPLGKWTKGGDARGRAEAARHRAAAAANNARATNHPNKDRVSYHADVARDEANAAARAVHPEPHARRAELHANAAEAAARGANTDAIRHGDPAAQRAGHGPGAGGKTEAAKRFGNQPGHSSNRNYSTRGSLEVKEDGRTRLVTEDPAEVEAHMKSEGFKLVGTTAEGTKMYATKDGRRALVRRRKT